MKVSQLLTDLRSEGCYLLRHGAKHDVWINPANGNHTYVPRHGSHEVSSHTLRSILKELGLM